MVTFHYLSTQQSDQVANPEQVEVDSVAGSLDRVKLLVQVLVERSVGPDSFVVIKDYTFVFTMVEGFDPQVVKMSTFHQMVIIRASYLAAMEA